MKSFIPLAKSVVGKDVVFMPPLDDLRQGALRELVHFAHHFEAGAHFVELVQKLSTESVHYR